jgi:hypothetical protein
VRLGCQGKEKVYQLYGQAALNERMKHIVESIQ